MDANQIEQDADRAAARGDYRAARLLLQKATGLVHDRFELWIKFAAMCRATSDPQASLLALDRALTINPFDFSALMMRATLLDQSGRVEEAGLGFGRALAQMPDRPPAQLQPVIDVARKKYVSWQDQQSAKLINAAKANAEITPRITRFIDNIIGRSQPDRVGPTHYCFPDLEEIPFHSFDKLPGLAALSEKTDAIKSEFETFIALDRAELTPYIRYPQSVPLEQWAALNHNKDWTALHLIERGIPNAGNTANCSKTMAAVSTLDQPQIAGAGPNIMFSLLAPNTHIPPHYGIANVRLVCHLPLTVPNGCWFRVGDDRREWCVGEPWVFDDTIEHEAMNPTDQLRVILIADVWHPDLDNNEKQAISAIIGAGGGIHRL
jgi:hypothetical protein